MNKHMNFARRQAPPGGRSLCQPQRRALRVESLHKALRQPSTGPITAPADVVYECLTLLRRPNLQSLAPFLPPASSDTSIRRVALPVGGELVEEVGPLACCHGFMDTAARRVLPGHLLRRCRVLSSWQLGDSCQQRVALTACTGEEAVFVWRLRRAAPPPAAPVTTGGDDGPTAEADFRACSGANGAGVGSSPGPQGAHPGSQGHQQRQHQQHHQEHQPRPPPEPVLSSRRHPHSAPPGSAAPSYGDGTATGISTADGGRNSSSSSNGIDRGATSLTATEGIPGRTAMYGDTKPGGDAFSACGSGSGSGSESESESELEPGFAVTQRTTAWIVESICRDDSNDDEELTLPTGPGGGGGPHPRCSPELVVKAQLAALRRGDVVGAASYNLWSRSTSGGWDLHLSAFRSLLRHAPYTSLLAAESAELGPAALPSPRRMLQEVRLRGLSGIHTVPGAGAGGATGCSTFVYQLGMQANGCWVVEAIRASVA